MVATPALLLPIFAVLRPTALNPALPALRPAAHHPLPAAAPPARLCRMDACHQQQLIRMDASADWLDPPSVSFETLRPGGADLDVPSLATTSRLPLGDLLLFACLLNLPLVIDVATEFAAFAPSRAELEAKLGCEPSRGARREADHGRKDSLPIIEEVWGL